MNPMINLGLHLSPNGTITQTPTVDALPIVLRFDVATALEIGAKLTEMGRTMAAVSTVDLPAMIAQVAL